MTESTINMDKSEAEPELFVTIGMVGNDSVDLEYVPGAAVLYYAETAGLSSHREGVTLDQMQYSANSSPVHPHTVVAPGTVLTVGYAAKAG